MTRIYKICTTTDWQAARAAGFFNGAGIDLQDGYIHFSSSDTVAETARKYFAGQKDLLLVEVLAKHLGDALKWEPARGGVLFPHLYGPLPTDRVAAVYPLPLDDVGNHIFPGALNDPCAAAET